ncbi:MAG TPA: NAD(P)-dependent oxidoreductase, partial [Steroidobacteraceae bacterium]|nr:NAD(P)-dependent oxidoreductase [Steroidobacteraceae bacterium]
MTHRSRLLVSRAVAAMAGVIAMSQAPVALAQSPATAPVTSVPSIEALIKDLGLRESDTPVRNRKDWRVPKKIVLLGGDPGTRAARDSFAAILPSAEIVVAPDFAAAVAAMPNADVVLGLTTNPGICETDIVKNAKQLRWLLSMSAGVERCVSNPEIVSRNLLLTNLRAVESATIGEHAVALALALARGLDRFVADTKQGQWKRESGARMQTLTGKTMLVVGLGGIGTEVASRAHGLGMKVTA